MDYEKVTKFNDWFNRITHIDDTTGSGSNSGVSVNNASGLTIGDVVDGFHLNQDGSVSLTGLQNYDLNGLIDQLGNYFRASDPRIQYAWSAQEAQKERDWQTAMSNTAYQRSMADMKAAGLNPILAYSQGGASSGSGAVASTSPVNTGASIGPIIQGVSSLLKTFMREDRKSDKQASNAALRATGANSAKTGYRFANDFDRAYNRYRRR